MSNAKKSTTVSATATAQASSHLIRVRGMMLIWADQYRTTKYATRTRPRKRHKRKGKGHAVVHSAMGLQSGRVAGFGVGADAVGAKVSAADLNVAEGAHETPAVVARDYGPFGGGGKSSSPGRR